MAQRIAKAGWMQRQSTVLRRWKRSWIVLYQDGVIKYYESPNNSEAEDAKLVKNMTAIKTALQVNDVTTMPPGSAVGCLIELVFSDSTWVLCAESLDDASAWMMSLEQARVASHSLPPTYPGQRVVYTGRNGAVLQPGQTAVICPDQYTMAYPRQAYYRQQPTQYVTADGQTTIVYADQPQYRRGYDGTDVALGVVAGAAVGSLMWGPFLWW